MITHNLPFEDKIRQTCLNCHKYMYVDIWNYLSNFQETQDGVQINHGKRAIIVGAI